MGQSSDPRPPASLRPTDSSARASNADRGSDAAQLDADEERKAREEESLNASTTHEVIRHKGAKELERPIAALAWSGLAAGLAMGLSLVAEGTLRAYLPDAPWRPLIAKFGYPVGFVAVILGSQQLFTENTLTPIVPLMAKRTREMLRRVLTLWGVVLIANLIGAAVFAWTAASTNVFSPEVKESFEAIAREAVEPTGWTLFARAIFAGWLIALMVWMLPAAGSAQLFVIVLMTWLVGVGHFAHVIVGSVEVLYLVARGGTSLDAYFLNYMLPTLGGNMVGGVTLVAALNHAQVTAGNKRADE